MMAYSHKANLGQKIIDKGHNLFLTRKGREWTGYLGQADFEGVSILKGRSVCSLQPTGEVLRGWRTPTVIESDNSTHLFCAKQAKRDRSIWRYQEIWRWQGCQGGNFNRIEKITDGSAPFIFKYNNLYYLYHHRQTDDKHQIVVLISNSLEWGWAEQESQTLIEKDYTISMPSVVYLNGKFWMTCEWQKSQDSWQTMLLSADSPTGSFKIVNENWLNHPCVYQHIFDDQATITYSKSNAGRWESWVAPQTTTQSGEINMRGLICIPTRFQLKYYITDRYELFFRRLANDLGFDICIGDHVPKSPDVDVVLVFKSPQHSNPDTFMGLVHLPKSIKLISYVVDLHAGHAGAQTVRYSLNMPLMLERSDVILCPYDAAFRGRWPDFVSKYIFFPHFFGPQKRYSGYELNENPLNRILLSGCVAPPYPLRTQLRDALGSKIDVLGHPGYHPHLGGTINEAYSQHLHKYLGAIATGSIFEYVVAKYFEIPAVGALLLGEQIPDLDKLGFIPNVHYVPITPDSALEVIEECCTCPGNYWEMRKRGMEFVRERHGEDARIAQLKKAIEEM